MQDIDRRYIYLLAWIFVLVPLINPLGLPVTIGKYSTEYYDYIESLPEDSVIMVTFDYGISAMPELYAFLRQQAGYEEPGWLRDALEKAEDQTPVIVDTAKAGTANICEATLGLFVRTLGTVAGNMAVSLLTRGGIYLGGGMPPRILKRLQEPDFLTAITDKGRFSNFLSGVPVHVILNSKVALDGAAWFGEEQLARG